TDLFALGCVLYECVTGALAFDGANVIAVLGKVLCEEPAPIAELRPDVPEALAALVSRLMSKKPELRPESAAAGRAMLAGVDAGQRAGDEAPRRPSMEQSSERRLISALLVDASGGIFERATQTPDEAAEEARRARRIVDGYGGQAAMLANHHLL